MALAALIIAVAGVILVGGCAWLMVRNSHDRLLAGLRVERIVVTVRAPRGGGKEEAFAGLLIAADRRSLLLRDCEALTATGRKPVDGELLLPRAEVAYIQHLSD